MASGSQVLSPNVTSKCGVTCPRGVREPGGVAGRGVKTWRHWPTWRQGARWRRRTWCQNVASLRKVAWQDMASKCGVTCLRGVREPGGVAGRGIKMWRHLPTWRLACAESLTWRRRTWRQNVASLAHVASGSHVVSPDVSSKRGVRRHGSTWRHRRPPCYIVLV